MARTISGLPKSMADKLTAEEIAYLQKIEKNAQPSTFDVADATTATTSATLTSRVVNDSLNGVAGTDPGGSPIGLGNSGGTTVNDSFTRLANILNALYTNDANLLAAIEELSDRVNALVGTVNEIIAAETPV